MNGFMVMRLVCRRRGCALSGNKRLRKERTMATIESSSTTFTREYTVGDPDDKASIKLRLSVPFDLPPERAKEILDDMVQALEIERDEYLEKRGIGRQLGLLDSGVTRATGWRDREPALGGLPMGDR